MSDSAPTDGTSTSKPPGDYPRRIAAATGRSEKTSLTADWVLQEFAAYYSESRHLPELAKCAFEEQDHATSLTLSKRRLALYSTGITELGVRLREAYPRVASDAALWREVEADFLPLIQGRYEADLAFAFINSVKRMIHQGEWEPVEYSFRKADEAMANFSGEIYRRFTVHAVIRQETILGILDTPGLSVPYKDRIRDAELVSERLNDICESRGAPAMDSIEMINAGFYRNRGGYIVGRVVMVDKSLHPLIIALLNSEDGIYVDAVLSSEADAHNIFSSTLANFHVTNNYYHELSEFLHSIMPKRPLGLHYSTIGFNHVGKVAVMNELRDELIGSDDVLETAVGFRGTVAIGFSSPKSAYNLKVIRDKPTANYKWGTFDGIESVMKKYWRVHEINRTGSMLDNIIYYNLKCDVPPGNYLSQSSPKAVLGLILVYSGKTPRGNRVTEQSHAPRPTLPGHFPTLSRTGPCTPRGIRARGCRVEAPPGPQTRFRHQPDVTGSRVWAPGEFRGKPGRMGGSAAHQSRLLTGTSAQDPALQEPRRLRAYTRRAA